MQAKVDEFPAIFLEWVPGMTLSQWITSFHKNLQISSSSDNLKHSSIISERDMKTILQLARYITKALADIHGAGATHNNFSPDNIIVDSINVHINMVVKIIGLGSASLQTDLGETSSKTQRDLLSLGQILFKMFAGRSPFQYNELFSEEEALESAKLLTLNQLIYMLTTK
eukprot:12730977-Ditylum_brightwellii.AAC.1